MSAHNPVKLTINLPRTTVEALRAVAERNGDTMTATMRDAITFFDYVEYAVKQGAELLIRRPNGEIIELVLPRWRHTNPRHPGRDMDVSVDS